jgi:hypothetical protein
VFYDDDADGGAHRDDAQSDRLDERTRDGARLRRRRRHDRDQRVPSASSASTLRAGRCGYDEASALVSSLVRPGDALVLTLPDGENEADRHGRLLRYVDTAQGVDVGAALLTAGLGIARYDSADGYPGTRARPRTTRLRRLGWLRTDPSRPSHARRRRSRRRLSRSRRPRMPRTPPRPQPVVDEWWRQYSSCTKLKKNPNGHPTGPFARDNPAEAAIYDWFAHGTGNNGDGEGDGLACE